MTMKVGGTQIDEISRGFFTGLLFTTSEEDFPEYCYSGEFEIGEEDILRFDPDAFIRVLETVSQIEEDCQEEFELLNAEGVSDFTLGAHSAFVIQETGTGFDNGERDGKMYRNPKVQAAQKRIQQYLKQYGSFQLFKAWANGGRGDKICVTRFCGKKR